MRAPNILHNVIGTVRKATEERVSLEIEGGTTRHFTPKKAKKTAITPLQPGDRVLLEFDEGNQIIDMIHIGQKDQLVLIHGEVIECDQDKKVFTLKLKNGTSQSYTMKDTMTGKMIDIKKGTAMTVMVDRYNYSAIDAHAD